MRLILFLSNLIINYMIFSFISGCLLVLIMYFFRFLLVLLISKLNKENFLKDFDFDFKQFVFEILLFGFVFFGFYVVDNESNFTDYIQHFFMIFLILLIPTYVYVLQPLTYLINKSNFIQREQLEKLIVRNYEIKIINKELINAYATGIIPFSKTILIGKPLIEKLTQDELLSIQLHEAGHLEKKHLDKLYIINLLLSVLFYFILFIRSSFFLTSNVMLNAIIVGVLGCFYGLLLWYVPGKIQYTFELEADKFSAKINGKENLINALEKLDILSKGEVSKGGITHPKLNVRIKNINNL